MYHKDKLMLIIACRPFDNWSNQVDYMHIQNYWWYHIRLLSGQSRNNAITFDWYR